MIWTIENGLTRSGPRLVQLVDARLEGLQASDPGRDGRTDPVGDRRDREPRVGLRLARGSEREMGEAIHPPRCLVVDVVGDLEIADLAREVDGIVPSSRTA